MLGIPYHLCDLTRAFEGTYLIAKFNWWLRGRRPLRLRDFSEEVVQRAKESKPRWLLATGIAPLEKGALEEMGRMGILRLNYLTDDPWSAVHQAGWFMEALPYYDQVFSPRRSNMADIHRLGCDAFYMPFAYDPEIHFPESVASNEEKARFTCDVVFVGGADRDRVQWVAPLIHAGFKVHLYGGYWDRFRETRASARGIADLQTFRKAVSVARVALCLVRRSNRDGHSMRSFELAAMGACILAEDTAEHREIFGEDGEAVVYFQGVEEVVEKLQWLLERESERRRLALAARARISSRGNTYADRLKDMIRHIPASARKD